MTTLHIEHPVSDLATWTAAFARYAEQRQHSGVRGQRVHHPVDDDHYVVIELDFIDRQQAQRFLDFLHKNVWSSPSSSPALAGTPQTKLLEPVLLG